MPEVTETDPEGIDFGWVMQVTFVVTIVIGAPVVAIGSLFVPTMSTWSARAEFAVRVGAGIWFLAAVITYLYARREQV